MSILFTQEMKSLLILPFVILSIFSNTSIASSVFVKDPENKLHNHNLTILIIPYRNMHIKYINYTDKDHEIQYPDSFYCKAVNGLLKNECFKKYQVYNKPEKFDELEDYFNLNNKLRFSELLKDSTNIKPFSDFVTEITAKTGVDLILYIYSCTAKHSISQEKGWSRSPNNSRPIYYKGETNIHIQVWDNKGKLLYEKISTGQHNKPLLYGIFKKRKKNKSIVQLSKRPYSPPLLKSIKKAITGSLNFEENM